MQRTVTIILTALIACCFAAPVFAAGESEAAASSTETDVVTLELWDELSRGGMMDATHPQNVDFAERFGVQFEAPMIPWNGGTDYLQQLRLRIASGDLPDVFMPWGGIEAELIANDALADITDLVPTNMPVFYGNVSDDVWTFIRSMSKDGESIYILPSVQYTPLGGMIRADWLERIGMEMPATVEEYVAVLRAFKQQDANGNGDPKDELPTSGREYGRWMDHLFAPFGVAMIEGYPDWAMYDGTVQYSAVQPEMKAAIGWIRELYAEGLLDPETFINTGKVWGAKTKAGKVGSWYHGLHWADSRYVPIYNSGVTEVNIEYLPVLQHPDYDGFYSGTEYRRPGFVFAAHLSDEEISRAMAALEWLNNPANGEAVLEGWEGVNYVMEGGKEVRLSVQDYLAQSEGQRVEIRNQLYLSAETLVDSNEFQMSLVDPDESSETKAIYQGLQTEIELVESYAGDTVRSIAGQFIPPSIYEGYPDIRSHKLYQEYASRIIVGEWELDRFDEFVERWYDTGGREVTERAQAAWAKIQ